MKPTPLPLDYDDHPERVRAAWRAVEGFGLAGDVHEPVAARLAAERLGPVLDLGCGEGRLYRYSGREVCPSWDSTFPRRCFPLYPGPV